MKNTFAFLFLAILTVVGCNKTETAAVETPEKLAAGKVTVKLTATDSVTVADSSKVNDNLTAVFKSKVLVFQNLRNKALLDSIYAPVNIRLNNYSKDSISSKLNTQKKAYFEGLKESLDERMSELPQTWEQSSSMKMFSQLHSFLTVQYKSDGYTGGAHGYYSELYRIFDLESNRKLELEDVLKVRDAKIWSRILMTHFLENDLERGQAEMLLVKEIPLNDNFYFDQQNVYFLYNQYEIAAYAAGPVLIKIPFSEIKPFLTRDFRNKLKLN